MRPWLLLYALPYLIFATCGDLMHAPSCPERLLLRWLGQRSHAARLGAPRHGPGVQGEVDCPACLWAGHATGKIVAPPAIAPGMCSAEIRYSDRCGVYSLPYILTRHSRGPPLS